MTLDPKARAALALHRFGFGPRVGGIAAAASDPQGAIMAEIEQPGAGALAIDLPSAAQASRIAFNARQQRQAQRIAQEIQKENQKQAMANADMAPSMEAKPEMEAAQGAQLPNVEQQIFQNEAKAHFAAAIEAPIGFAERWVWFWSNHFCVSADVVPNMAGGYEREAIRPHAFGRFADMLLAVEQHPAMLVYLDNQRSIGPNSVAGLIDKRGLNENLAREILELHTLGVRSVYEQKDVTALAKVITGWTLIPPATNPDHGSEFVFNPRMHEPGPISVLGKSYTEDGAAQGRAVLADIARHPATATHVARKLARHFSADDPPPALVDRLTRAFTDSDGDMKTLAKTLVASPECWSETRAKFKRPSEWIVSVLRATASPYDVGRLLRGQALMGEPLWRPSAPKGFADEETAWVDGLSQRADIANQFGERVAARVEPEAILENSFGPLASRDTKQTVARAESRAQALTLLFMAPEFQRR